MTARAVVLLALALPFALGGCSERMGAHWDWERMRAQKKDAAYGADSFSPNGSAMRAPPEGTVAQESKPAAEARPATVDLARGASRYHIFCAVCHGERGDGVSIVGSNMDQPGPPSLLVAPVTTLSPAQLYGVITAGVVRMPPFSSQLSPADRWQVVAYVAELQRRAQSAAATPPAAP